MAEQADSKDAARTWADGFILYAGGMIPERQPDRGERIDCITEAEWPAMDALLRGGFTLGIIAHDSDDVVAFVDEVLAHTSERLTLWHDQDDAVLYLKRREAKPEVGALGTHRRRSA